MASPSSEVELARRAVRSFALCLTLGLSLRCADSEPAPSSASPAQPSAAATGARSLSLALRSTSPTTTDPAASDDAYENQLGSMVYEPLLQYRVGVKPLQLEPLLLSAMPEVSEGGRVLTFPLKEGVRFHDSPCFPGGRGRELVAQDVVRSWKRLADGQGSPSPGWSLLANTIVGLDAYHEGRRRGELAVDAPVEGLRALDARRLRVELIQPQPSFLNRVARFQLAVVPHEAVSYHGAAFGRHPVGTGPYTLAEGDWTEQGVRFQAFEGYHAGQGERPLPRVPELRFTFFDEDSPMWQRYTRERSLDFVQVPREALDEVLTARGSGLSAEYEAGGHQLVADPTLDCVYYGINLRDPVLGGQGETARKLRQALQLATDLDEVNEVIYRSRSFVFDGILPPGLDGHPRTPDRRAPGSLRGPDLDRARRLLAEAGYPGGEGLPALSFGASSHPANRQQLELIERQWARIGVRLKFELCPFGELQDRIAAGSLSLFAMGLHSDYPDATANLACFWGPNIENGTNTTHYADAGYDARFEQVRCAPLGPERTASIEVLRDQLIRDVPVIGTLGRVRHYLAQPWVREFHPSEDHYAWIKYIDLDARPAAAGER